MFKLRRKPLAAGVAAVLLFAAVGWSYLAQLRATRQSEATALTSAFAQRLIERFYQTVAPAYMMAARVDQKSGEISEFEDNAAEFVRSFPLIRAVELAPGGIVTYVYPLSGNEQIIGHDLLKDRERNKEAWVAVSRRELAVAGPLELKQGGVGAIARYPVYRILPDGRQAFWGFSIVVVDFPALMRLAGATELERAGYLSQICWVPHAESVCRTKLGDEIPKRLEPVFANLQLSSANWRVVVAPPQGWVSAAEWGLMLALALLGGGLVGAAAYWCDARRQELAEDETPELTTPAG